MSNLKGSGWITGRQQIEGERGNELCLAVRRMEGLMECHGQTGYIRDDFLTLGSDHVKQTPSVLCCGFST